MFSHLCILVISYNQKIVPTKTPLVLLSLLRVTWNDLSISIRVAKSCSFWCQTCFLAQQVLDYMLRFYTVNCIFIIFKAPLFRSKLNSLDRIYKVIEVPEMQMISSWDF